MKLLKILIATLLTLGIFSLTACSDDTAENSGGGGLSGNENYSQNLVYKLNEDNQSYTLTGIGKSTDVTVIIPKTHDNLPVTAIGSEAFKNNQLIQTVYIPETILTIQNQAFYGCSHLRSVMFVGDSFVAKIDNYAFFDCVSLESFNFPKSVRSIGEYAFSGCVKLNSVTYAFGSDLKEINAYAFAGCITLTGMWIPKSVEFIHETAFYGCKNLITNQ